MLNHVRCLINICVQKIWCQISNIKYFYEMWIKTSNYYILHHHSVVFRCAKTIQLKHLNNVFLTLIGKLSACTVTRNSIGPIILCHCCSIYDAVRITGSIKDQLLCSELYTVFHLSCWWKWSPGHLNEPCNVLNMKLCISNVMYM